MKKKLPVFYKIYFTVLALLLVAAGAGLFWLRGFLADYEAAQPKHAADAIYAQYYASGDFAELAKKCAGDDPFLSPDALATYLTEACAGKELSWSSGTATDGQPTYVVKAGDVKISSFTLRQKEEPGARFARYEADTFTCFYQTDTAAVVAPAGYTVSVNGIDLSKKYITEKDLPGEGDHLLPEGVAGVKYNRYEVTILSGAPIVTTASSPEGVPAPIAYDETEQVWKASPLFDDSLEAEHAAFTIEAVEAYARYMSADASFGAISGYFDPDSALYEDVRDTITYFVIDHDSVDFENAAASEFYGYSDDVFSCHVTLTQVLTQGTNQFRDYFDYTLFFRYTDTDEWKICGMINRA